jgi:hypothetical protein
MWMVRAAAGHFHSVGLCRHVTLYRSALTIRIWFLFHFGCQFNHSPDCFSPRRQIGLGTTPIIYSPQKRLRDSHLKGAILGTSFRTAARPIFGHLGI